MDQSILLVEDEPGLRMTLSDRIRDEGYDVETAVNGVEGFEKASRGPFSLIILDVMLPRKNGLDVCRDLRHDGIKTPILMLTARTQTFDKVVGLKIGADDYLTKPFEMPELLARMEALLRRPPLRDSAICQFGSIRFDARRTEVYKDGKQLLLSAREFQLLQYFIAHRGDTLSREELLRGVWGYEFAPSTRTVDVHVAWLRQKLENDPKHPRRIVTVHGFGYRFNA
ncbi:MAG TPA: response regulator transcription factor [Bryobacteraceae bacterium]|jgi:two-component system alkaline phosphatase synthesis response regulator PhoP|nr:response regulator transcription factor [Bryobacteraceae bacterium]